MTTKSISSLDVLYRSSIEHVVCSQTKDGNVITHISNCMFDSNVTKECLFSYLPPASASRSKSESFFLLIVA